MTIFIFETLIKVTTYVRINIFGRIYNINFGKFSTNGKVEKV